MGYSDLQKGETMKTLRSLAMVVILAGLCCASALAWTCPAGQRWVQVPAGTPGARVIEGISFQCQPDTPPATGGVNKNTNKNTNTNTSNSTSSATATATAKQSQKQQQEQSQTATGGKATSNATAANNGNNSNNTTFEAPKIPVSSAIAPPVLPSAPCTKGYSGAAQGGVLGASFGASKIDEGCDARELARSFAGISRIAQCKILVNTKAAKKAGVTMEDCMYVPPVPVVVIPPAPVVEREALTPAPAPLPIVIVVPAPVVGPRVIVERKPVRKVVKKACPSEK